MSTPAKTHGLDLLVDDEAAMKFIRSHMVGGIKALMRAANIPCEIRTTDNSLHIEIKVG